MSPQILSETHFSCPKLAFLPFLALLTNKGDMSGGLMDILRKLDTMFQDGAPFILMKADQRAHA